MKYLYIIAVLFIFSACSPSKKNRNTSAEDNAIDSLLVTYYCGDIESHKAIRCEKLERYQKLHQKNDYSGPPISTIDTFIVDSNVLPKIEKLLERNTYIADFEDDARMFVTIKHQGGKEDYLCISHKLSPVQHNETCVLDDDAEDCLCISQQLSPVKYNGKACSFDNELTFLLRYYSGYYDWFNSADLQWLEELQDTVFYKKALEQKKR
ncbi:hypothetical protein AGMMS4957_19570 [Bacteroidia bacterium]|nr:hypothetical protein AGMMS4957_19570 [Bacteroidia bacterium]